MNRNLGALKYTDFKVELVTRNLKFVLKFVKIAVLWIVGWIEADLKFAHKDETSCSVEANFITSLSLFCPS